jgi:hypothetical protein
MLDLLPFAGGLLETSHSTPKIDKGTVVNFFSRWTPRTVEHTVT